MPEEAPVMRIVLRERRREVAEVDIFLAVGGWGWIGGGGRRGVLVGAGGGG